MALIKILVLLNRAKEDFKEISNPKPEIANECCGKKIEDVMQRAIELGAHLGDVPFDQMRQDEERPVLPFKPANNDTDGRV